MYKELRLPHPLSQEARSLQEFFTRKQQELCAEIAKDAPRVLTSDHNETAYVQSLVNKYTLSAPQLDIEHIHRDLHYEDTLGLLGRTIKQPVVTFSVPFTGEINLLQYIPRQGSSSSLYEFTLQGSSICFKVESPGKDAEETRVKKEQVLTFLQQRIEGVLPELDEYNRGVKGNVVSLIEQQKKHRNDDNDFLSKL